MNIISNMEILCNECSTWVDCGIKNNKPYGFCLQKDLFTYTAETQCSAYIKGTPISELEYELYNSGEK